jgi:hypothetical protein
MFAVALPAHAQYLMRQVNLAYLTQRADIIVQGRVANVRYGGLPGYPHIPTVLVTIQVERMLRGPEGNTYTFRQFLPRSEQRGGKQGYLAGQRLLLFLPSPSSAGLSSPIGHEQGRFHIASDAHGNDTIANGYGNAGLFKGVAGKAEQEGVSLSGKQLRLTSAPVGPVALEDFVALVDRLKLLPRIE